MTNKRERCCVCLRALKKAETESYVSGYPFKKCKACTLIENLTKERNQLYKKVERLEGDLLTLKANALERMNQLQEELEAERTRTKEAQEELQQALYEAMGADE